MARKKSLRLITKAETVRQFGLTRDQVNYLFRKFGLRPLAIAGDDHRCKWYRYRDVAAIIALPLTRRAKAA